MSSVRNSSSQSGTPRRKRDWKEEKNTRRSSAQTRRDRDEEEEIPKKDVKMRLGAIPKKKK